METEKNRMRKLVIGFGVFILVVGVFAIIMYLNSNVKTGKVAEKSPSNDDKQLENLILGDNLVRAFVNTDINSSIDDLQQLTDNTPDALSRARSIQYLVIALLQRDIADDALKAIKLTEEILNDFTLPPKSRAMALNALTVGIMFKDETFFSINFANTSFKKYLNENGNSNSFQVAIRMFKEAETIHKTAFAEYYLASAYYELLKLNKLADGAQSKEDMAMVIQSYVSEGDKNIETDNTYNPGSLANLYFLSATLSSYSGRLLNNMTTEKRLLTYVESIAKIKGLVNNNIDPRVFSTLLMAQFHFAGILMTETVGRENDIRDALKAFSEVDLLDNKSKAYERSNKYFKGLYQNATSSQKSRALGLAKISPEFRDYLIQLGWQI